MTTRVEALAVRDVPIPAIIPMCYVCLEPTDMKCARCFKAFFCSIECINKGWSKHSAFCRIKMDHAHEAERKVKQSLRKLKKLGGQKEYDELRKIYDTSECNVESPCVMRIEETAGRQLLCLAMFLSTKPCDLDYSIVPFFKKMDEAVPSGRFPSSAFIFGNEKWYQDDDITYNALYGPEHETMKFLNTKAFMLTMCPEVGTIVVYSTHVFDGRVKHLKRIKVSHYGIITSFNNGHLNVKSVFFGEVFEHPIETIPYFFGTFCNFVNKLPIALPVIKEEEKSEEKKSNSPSKDDEYIRAR